MILQNKDGNLVPGAIATMVDELGAAVIHVEGQPMDVSIDMSINYLATAKMGVRFLDPISIFFFIHGCC